MRCSTCGERLTAGKTSCPVCGASVSHLLTAPADEVTRCPRCRYTGEGISYFRKPGHMALLVGASLFSYGIGGLVYWLMKRGSLICPNCGLTWHGSGDRFLERLPGRGGARASARNDVLPSAGMKRRVLGIIMLLIATVAIVAGIAEFEAAAIAAGSVVGVGGSGMFFWGWRALQDRRAALAHGLERRVLQLATRLGGSLTVTEVAAELDLSLPAAEKVLGGMDDGFRVRSDVTDEGVIVYEFPEVRHRRMLEPPQA